MKVLITLPVKVGFDGMTKQILSYGKYMDRDNLEIDLLSCRGFDPDMKSLVDEAHFDHIYRLEYRDTNQVKYFFDLLKLMRKRKYDVIHANGQSATLAIEMTAAKMTGCRVRIAHSHNSMCLHKKAHKLLKPLFMATYTDAIACSKEAGDWLFDGRKYWILNNGIDVAQFKFDLKKREQIRNELGLIDTDIAIGNVAAFEPKKNQMFLIDVFNKIKDPNYKLFLWGIDGTTKKKVLDKIKELGMSNKIIYMGTTDKMADYLNAMDLMLLPSKFEGFPVTVVEWQANGLPCIVSNTITRKCNINGLVTFLPIDKGTNIWVEKIKQYNNDIEKRSDIKYQQLLYESGFDIEKNANDLKRYYLKKLEEK